MVIARCIQGLIVILHYVCIAPGVAPHNFRHVTITIDVGSVDCTELKTPRANCSQFYGIVIDSFIFCWWIDALSR
jgi:hypothetical protein